MTIKLDYYYDQENDVIFESEEHFKDYKKTQISFSSSDFKPEDFNLSIIEIESPDEPNTNILKKEIFEEIYKEDEKWRLKVSIVDITEEEKKQLEEEKKVFIEGEIEYWEKEIEFLAVDLENPTEEEIENQTRDYTNAQNEIDYVNALKASLSQENFLTNPIVKQSDYL
jgi:hypothetical protein